MDRADIKDLKVRHVTNYLGGTQTIATYKDPDGAHRSAHLSGYLAAYDAVDFITTARRRYPKLPPLWDDEGRLK